MTITAEQFGKMFPANAHAQEWTDALNSVLPRYTVTLADFLAQCGHESEGFTALVENLNYSAEALLATWPARFAGVADQYARKPEAIGNRAYANRMGNGDEASGDGYLFRGHGLIQLTGRDNVTAFAHSIGRTVEDTLTYLTTREGAVESACWFWKDRGLEQHAGDVTAMTKAINGGLNGLDDRQARYQLAVTVLA